MIKMIILAAEDALHPDSGFAFMIRDFHAAGYRVVILSNNSDMGPIHTRELLEEAGFEGVSIYSSAEFGLEKSEIFLLACDKEKVQPEECLFIDSKQEDLDIACSFGIPGILFHPAKDSLPRHWFSDIVEPVLRSLNKGKVMQYHDYAGSFLWKKVEDTRRTEEEQQLLVNQVLKTTTPAVALASRRGRFSVWGDAFVFKITDETLNSIFKLTLEQLTALLEEAFQVTERDWGTLSKEDRRRYKHYKVQKLEAVHFSFYSTTPPSTGRQYFDQKITQMDQQWYDTEQCIQEYLNTNPSMVLKEIKMNEDGHIVIRMTIQDQETYLKMRKELDVFFNKPEQRYSEPEKILTLASVIGVCDISSLDESKRKYFFDRLSVLFETLTQKLSNKPFLFSEIRILEWTNRMLREKGVIGEISIRSQSGISCSM